MTPMSESEVREFLAARDVGILGLPGEGAPYLVPLSYAFDGGSSVYFTFVLGETSRKEALAERADDARFLVYAADSPFQWESVLVEGPIEAVPESELEDAAELLTTAWRPQVLQRAGTSGNVRLYRLRATDTSGIRHTGLPPGFSKPGEE